MNNFSRILVLLGALSMSLLFFFPLWKIYLQAPQYPEGLEMHIWVNKITGNTDYTLQNFNILNHYIGMKPIVAESFAELKIMPIVVYGLMLSGLLVALLKNKYLMAGWLGLLATAGAVGLLDFYLWLVDYGTNLDPSAPIKIPGMTYIPPFIGHKDLLNFSALSLPAMGSLGVAIPLVLVAYAVYLEFFHLKKNRQRKWHPSYGMGVLLLLLAGCSVAPQPIAYGQSGCEHCKMTISDARYGAEIVTTTGKAYFFDAVECMAAYLQEHEAVAQKAALLLVADFSQPASLIDAERAVYLQSKTLPSPMGLYLTALGQYGSARELQQTHQGRLLQWADVKQAVKEHENEY